MLISPSGAAFGALQLLQLLVLQEGFSMLAVDAGLHNGRMFALDVCRCHWQL